MLRRLQITSPRLTTGSRRSSGMRSRTVERGIGDVDALPEEQLPNRGEAEAACDRQRDPFARRGCVGSAQLAALPDPGVHDRRVSAVLTGRLAHGNPFRALLRCERPANRPALDEACWSRFGAPPSTIVYVEVRRPASANTLSTSSAGRTNS